MSKLAGYEISFLLVGFVAYLAYHLTNSKFVFFNKRGCKQSFWLFYGVVALVIFSDAGSGGGGDVGSSIQKSQ